MSALQKPESPPVPATTRAIRRAPAPAPAADPPGSYRCQGVLLGARRAASAPTCHADDVRSLLRNPIGDGGGNGGSVSSSMGRRRKDR